MIQTTDELRQMVVNVVKVKENTDPTKTQGSRLRQLLYNILDTVEDLVEKQGLSVYQGVMQELDTQQNAAIQALRDEVTALIEAIPDHSIYALKAEIKESLGYYVLSETLTGILEDYLKIDDYQPFSKKYSDLLDVPDLSVYQLKSDRIAYSRLDGTPTIITSYSQLTDKPTLFDGDYNKLVNKPTIPAAQVQSDWNATTGLGAILNKPALFDKSYTSLTNIPTTFTPSAHTHTIADITGLQTSLNSITKYYTSAGLLNQNIKKWTTIITPTTSQGFTIDISSAGFTQILGIQIQTERNTTSANDALSINIKSKTNTQIAVNIYQNNTATVAILGINVLSGLPLIFATNLSNILLHVEVTGY